MILIHEKFAPGQEIPVGPCLRNRKLIKYFNRETSAFLLAMHRMSQQFPNGLPANLPFYYSTGKVESEDYGLETVYKASIDEQHRFQVKGFVEDGMAKISPLTQFKVLYNMPLCFASIEHKMTGDNAVLYGDVRGLFTQCLCSNSAQVILGAGKSFADGSVQAGCAVATLEELMSSSWRNSTKEAIHFFASAQNGEIT